VFLYLLEKKVKKSVDDFKAEKNYD